VIEAPWSGIVDGQAMPSHRTVLLALAPVALAAAAAAAPGSASACGGTFCDGGPQVMPVDQTGESILFVMQPGWVEAHVRIDYQGDPANFAWLVPIPLPTAEELEVSVGSQALLDRLLTATVPTFTLDSAIASDCFDEPGPSCGARSSFLEDGFDGFEEEDPDTPSVVAHDVAGAYEYAVLQGGTVDGVGQWLDDNGYARDDEAPEILQAYLDEGFSFVAFKLRPGTDLDQIHPVVLRYPGSEPCIPLRLTRIAAVEDMKIRAFFLGSDRVVPTNYRHVELNPLRIDWFRLGGNYDILVSQALDQEGADGRAFVTEYAGSSSVVPWAGLRGFAWRSEDFLDVTGATLSQTLQAQGLFGCDTEGCGPSHPLLMGLLRTYFPAPPEVPEGELYQCSECNTGFDESMWDPAGFAAAFEEQIVGPAEHAVDVLGDNPYLTRLYTMISPGEMTTDPLFHARHDLPEVTNEWTATQLNLCEEDEHDRLDIGGGVSIVLDEIDGLPLFPEMSAAARIEEYPLDGAPVVLLDATHDNAAQLAAWNESQSPSGCQCRASGRRTQGAGWLGLLLLLGLRARGPGARARARQRIANS
jgi:hypothetical protein